jgi:hypothetical protein
MQLMQPAPGPQLTGPVGNSAGQGRQLRTVANIVKFEYIAIILQ